MIDLSVIIGYNSLLYNITHAAQLKGQVGIVETSSKFIHDSTVQFLHNNQKDEFANCLHHHLQILKDLYVLAKDDKNVYVNKRYIDEVEDIVSRRFLFLIEHEIKVNPSFRGKEYDSKYFSICYAYLIDLFSLAIKEHRYDVIERIILKLDGISQSESTYIRSLRYKSEKDDCAHPKFVIENSKDIYRRITVISLFSWLTFLYQIGKFPGDKIKRYLSLYRRNYEDDAFLISDVLYVRTSFISRELGLDNLDYKERLLGRAYSPPNPSIWIIRGLVLFQGMGSTVPYMVDVPGDLKASYGLLGDEISEMKNAILSIKDKISSLIDLSEQELSDRIDNLSKSLQSYKYQNRVEELKAIARQEIDLDLVYSIQEKLNKEIFKNSHVLHMYKYNLVADYSWDNSKDKPLEYGFKFTNGRRGFVIGESSVPKLGEDYIIKSYGNFVDKIFQKVIYDEYREHNDIKSDLQTALDELDNHNVKANIIFAPSSRFNELLSIDSFSYNKVNADEDFRPIAFIAKIPVYVSRETYGNMIYVINMRNAIRLVSSPDNTIKLRVKGYEGENYEDGDKDFKNNSETKTSLSDENNYEERNNVNIEYIYNIKFVVDDINLIELV